MELLLIDNNRIEITYNLIISYLSNIFNINLLILSLAVISLWNFRETKNKWKNLLIYSSIFLGVFTIIFSVFSYRDIISDILHIGINKATRAPTPEKFLYRLNYIFWMDILIIVLLITRFIARDDQ